MTKIMEKPIPSFIIVFIVTFILTSIMSEIFKAIFGIFAPELSSFLGVIISGIIIGIIYIYVFKIKGFFSFSNSKLALILISPAFLFVIFNALDPAFAIPTTAILAVTVIISGIGPGIFEEIMFRGIVISYLMKMFRNSKNILPIVIVSALIFGVLHLFNAFMGAPLDITIFQFVVTFGMGILFAAVYLRTGNLWIPIILHSLNDIVAFCCTSAISSHGVIQTGFVFNWLNIITIIVSIICIVLGLYYVRSTKHDEILEIWEEKWAN